MMATRPICIEEAVDAAKSEVADRDVFRRLKVLDPVRVRAVELVENLQSVEDQRRRRVRVAVDEALQREEENARVVVSGEN